MERFSDVEEQVSKLVGELIRTKEFVEFYIGRNGEFDLQVASIIKREQRNYGYDNSSLVLVLPYPISNLDDMESYYDEVWYPSELQNVHYKAAIGKRNEWFVKNSDVLVAYVEKEEGGAYLCAKKALKDGVEVKWIGKVSECDKLFSETIKQI
ncbi:MAG: hypothetical protein K5753_01970 [Clostridia bacterium]|nr:hypothetical protein [Clostridia bacterium]